ncbi:MAG: LysR family transcriptional regulator [Erysipelotrichaceae bacterium]|nr:LysR family transcriptional regulator [Erysipelotrichaceae bacterium]
MDIQKISSFCTVYECGSISKASEKLFCSQPALSKQISSLESELGYTLFERNGKKITINDNARVFYRFAKNLLNDYALLKRELFILNNPTHHEVRFGTTNFIGTYVLPSVLKNFKMHYSTTPVNFIVNFLPYIMDMLDNDLINFAVIPASDEILNNKKYICDAFLEDEFVLVVPPNHPLTEKESISIKDIAEYTFLISQEQSATRQFISKTLRNHQVQLQSTINMDNINAIKHGIINGIGISILPKEQVKKDEQFGLLKTYKFNDAVIKRMLYVVYKNKHTFLEEEAIFIKQFIKH